MCCPCHLEIPSIIFWPLCLLLNDKKTMNARIFLLLLLVQYALAQYEHVVNDDLVSTTIATETGEEHVPFKQPEDFEDDTPTTMAQDTHFEDDDGTPSSPQLIHFDDDFTSNANIFLRATPNAGIEDDRGRTTGSTTHPPPTTPLKTPRWNFGSMYRDNLPSTSNSNTIQGYYYPYRHNPKNKWAAFQGYVMGKTKKSKGMKSKSYGRKRWKKSIKSKSMKTKSMKKTSYGRKRWKMSMKSNKTPYFWWAKGGYKYGKGNGKGKWRGKGKGHKWTKGKGQGKFVNVWPTMTPAVAPPTSRPTVTLKPTTTLAPTNFPTRPVLVFVSSTGEDRTIQVQGNGGAEGAANPRLKVDRVGSEQDQVVIKFTDLNDNIPTGSTIVSAYLSIVTTTVTQRTVNWHRLLVPWEEETVNGRYFGTGIPPINSEILVQPDNSEALAIPAITFVGNSDVVIDLTVDVQYWINNPGTNNGWAIIADENDPEGLNEWGFWGLDSANNAPALVISYIPP